MSRREYADKTCPSCTRAVPYFNNHCFSCSYDYPKEPSADEYPRQLTVSTEWGVFLWGSVLAASQLPGLDAGVRCFLWFQQDCAAIGWKPKRSPEDEIVISYADVTSLNIGGRGILTETSGGGFIGGGFGAQGAFEGMAIASALNALTTKTRTSVETFVEFAAGSRALLLLNSDEAPSLLRTHLAPAFANIEEAHQRTTSMIATQPGSPTDRLAQLKMLGELRDAGVLTADEFASEKARILQS